MPLAGKALLPRQIAQLGRVHWQGAELVKMVATALGESAGYVGAWHDNLDTGGDGVPVSRDCGLMQINLPADEIGTGAENALRSTSTDATVYEPVAKANIAAGYRLYEQPGPNTGLRRWEPWVAYTTGWATLPAWWVWQQNTQGQGVGPWHRTGRYIQRAVAGVANYHLLIAKDKTTSEAVAFANTLAGEFFIEGDLGMSGGFVGWTHIPAMPLEPPSNGIGPRPITNSGA